MLDARVYRTAFLPALVALFVAAFALAGPPDPGALARCRRTCSRAERAFGSASPEPQSLNGLARPSRTAPPGRPATRGWPTSSRTTFEAPDEDAASAPAVHRPPRRRATRERDLETVIATRPGHLDRAGSSCSPTATRPGRRASLSGTAALLELARVLKSRDLRKTLVLVSTPGATTGFAGARAWAQARGRRAGRRRDRARRHGRDADQEAVGRLAGRSSRGAAAARPRAHACRPRCGARPAATPGGPRALGQWMRRALP